MLLFVPFCKMSPVQWHSIADITNSATVRKGLLRVFAEGITYQCYALTDVLTMPPGGGGDPRHGAPKWALGAVMLHSFVPLDSTVTCPLHKLTLAHRSQVILHLTASLCYLL